MNGLPLDGVVVAYNSGFQCYGRLVDSRFNFCCSKPMSRNVDDIIYPANHSNESVRIPASTVACEIKAWERSEVGV